MAVQGCQGWTVEMGGWASSVVLQHHGDGQKSWFVWKLGGNTQTPRESVIRGWAERQRFVLCEEALNTRKTTLTGNLQVLLALKAWARSAADARGHSQEERRRGGGFRRQWTVWDTWMTHKIHKHQTGFILWMSVWGTEGEWLFISRRGWAADSRLNNLWIKLWLCI